MGLLVVTVLGTIVSHDNGLKVEVVSHALHKLIKMMTLSEHKMHIQQNEF